MSDIGQLFNNPKERTRDTDESVAMSSFADELSVQTSDIRLSSLVMLSNESVRAESIDMNAFVDEFDSTHGNRKLGLH